jgi:glycosyltransferase involved in cell wall biosynthesis
VCIPLFNGGADIEGALHSVLDQDLADWECIVVDDASTDDSLLRARRVVDRRITVVAASTNVGLAANWTRALHRARAPFALLLGQDDRLQPHALGRFAATLLEHPSAAMVACGGTTPKPGPPGHSPRKHVGVVEAEHLYRFAIELRDTPPPSQTAYRTSVLRSLEGFDARFSYCPEVDLQFRIGRAGHAAVFLDEALVQRGNDEGRLSGRVGRTARPLRDLYRLLEKHQDAVPELVDGQRRRLRRRAAIGALRRLREGRPRVAASHLKTAALGEWRLRRRR